MKKQTKRLTLNKETLRDLTAHNAAEVKGGGKTMNRKCYTGGRTCDGHTCGWCSLGTLCTAAGC